MRLLADENIPWATVQALASRWPRRPVGQKPRLLVAQQGLNIPAPMDDVKNQNCVIFDAIDDDVVADGKSAQPRTQVQVTTTADPGVICQQREAISDIVDDSVGGLEAAAPGGDVRPDMIQI